MFYSTTIKVQYIKSTHIMTYGRKKVITSLLVMTSRSGNHIIADKKLTVAAIHGHPSSIA